MAQITASKCFFLAKGHHPVFAVRIFFSICRSDSAAFPSMSSFLTTGPARSGVVAHPITRESTAHPSATLHARRPALPVKRLSKVYRFTTITLGLDRHMTRGQAPFRPSFRGW